MTTYKREGAITAHAYSIAIKPQGITLYNYAARIFLMLIAMLLIVVTTKAQTGNADKYKYTFTVAKDGSGDYKYIQEAIDAMRVYPLAPITLYIKNGVYNEKIELPANNTDVTFIGEDVDKTIITFNDYSGRGKLTTFTSYTAKISGNRFTAQNITFVNNAGRVGQAVALYVDADKAVFKNCKFIGDQDTIFSAGETSRQLFVDCYVEGTTDFIFGPSTAVFQNCTIKEKTNSYITAASTTPGKKFGYVFLDCKITATDEATKVFLGRPWRAHAKTVFIRCEMPAQIAAEGWNNWGNPENEKTVLYAEYKSKGAGAHPAGRVGWSKQLTDKEAAAYTLENIFASGSNPDLPGEKDWFKQTSLKPFSWPVKK
jgi:pectinesterase